MARLLSVNVGLPREITWRGKTIFTSVWKEPVQGRRLVRRLNIDGDAQGDLAGHGGEHRAVSASCGCGLNNREKTGTFTVACRFDGAKPAPDAMPTVNAALSADCPYLV
jgi:hypothetical protein